MSVPPILSHPNAMPSPVSEHTNEEEHADMLGMFEKLEDMICHIRSQICRGQLSCAAVKVKLTRLLEMIALFIGLFPQASMKIYELMMAISELKGLFKSHFRESFDQMIEANIAAVYQQGSPQNTQEQFDKKVLNFGGALDSKMDDAQAMDDLQQMNQRSLGYRFMVGGELKTIALAVNGPMVSKHRFAISSMDSNADATEYAKGAMMSARLKKTAAQAVELT